MRETISKLYVAVTGDNIDQGILEKLHGLPIGIKVGLELFVSRGSEVLETIRNLGYSLFLDLKFHDIPYTVAGAVRSVNKWEPDLLNVHASGGIEMMRAASGAVEGRTHVIAVTLLTSLDRVDLKRMNIDSDPADLVVNLACSAREAGLYGVVCSPHEVAGIRKETGSDFFIITPGIRPVGFSSGDQKRIATPLEAIEWGADSIVVGRPIISSSDPAETVRGILKDIQPGIRP